MVLPSSVLSRIKFTSVLALAFMKKLDQPMVNWICREMNARTLSVWSIARRAGVSKQWVYELYARYLASGVPRAALRYWHYCSASSPPAF